MIPAIPFLPLGHVPDLANPKQSLDSWEFERILSFNYQKQRHLRHGDLKTPQQRKEAKSHFVKMSLREVITDLENQVKNDQKIIGTALSERFANLECLDLQHSDFSSSEAFKVEQFLYRHFPRLKNVFMPCPYIPFSYNPFLDMPPLD